jgi:hypothetical protein
MKCCGAADFVDEALFTALYAVTSTPDELTLASFRRL